MVWVILGFLPLLIRSYVAMIGAESECKLSTADVGFKLYSQMQFSELQKFDPAGFESDDVYKIHSETSSLWTI